MPPPLPKRTLYLADQKRTVKRAFERRFIPVRLTEPGHRIDRINLIRETPDPASHHASEAVTGGQVTEGSAVALILDEDLIGLRSQTFHVGGARRTRHLGVGKPGQKPSQLHRPAFA